MFGSSFQRGGEQRERDLDHRVVLASAHLVRVDERHQEPEQFSKARKAVRNEAPVGNGRILTKAVRHTRAIVTQNW